MDLLKSLPSPFKLKLTPSSRNNCIHFTQKTFKWHCHIHTPCLQCKYYSQKTKKSHENSLRNTTVKMIFIKHIIYLAPWQCNVNNSPLLSKERLLNNVVTVSFRLKLVIFTRNDISVKSCTSSTMQLVVVDLLHFFQNMSLQKSTMPAFTREDLLWNN